VRQIRDKLSSGNLSDKESVWCNSFIVSAERYRLVSQFIDGLRVDNPFDVMFGDSSDKF